MSSRWILPEVFMQSFIKGHLHLVLIFNFSLNCLIPGAQLVGGRTCLHHSVSYNTKSGNKKYIYENYKWNGGCHCVINFFGTLRLISCVSLFPPKYYSSTDSKNMDTKGRHTRIVRVPAEAGLLLLYIIHTTYCFCSCLHFPRNTD